MAFFLKCVTGRVREKKGERGDFFRKRRKGNENSCNFAVVNQKGKWKLKLRKKMQKV